MIEVQNVRPIGILLVEDNPGDAKLAKEALAESKLINSLHTVENGQDALDFLYKRGKFSNASKPDLILLDLNLPIVDGREVLREIKDDDNLKRIPVVVLTTSQSEEDIFKTYNLHANCYVTKPLDLDQFLSVVKSIQDFWLVIAKLPNGYQT